jgi:hypothetical protein
MRESLAGCKVLRTPAKPGAFAVQRMNERTIDKSTTKQVFVCQASGHVREFNTWDVFVFNTLGYALGLVLASAPTFLGGLYAVNLPALINLGGSLGHKITAFFIDTIILAAVFLISVVGIRTLKRFLNSLFIVAFVGTLCMMFVFLASTHDDFVREFDTFMPTHANTDNAYQAVDRHRDFFRLGMAPTISLPEQSFISRSHSCTRSPKLSLIIIDNRKEQYKRTVRVSKTFRLAQETRIAGIDGWHGSWLARFAWRCHNGRKPFQGPGKARCLAVLHL